MMDILFFAAIIAYFAATMLQAVAAAMGKDKAARAARRVRRGIFAAHGVHRVARRGGRPPAAGQSV